MDHHRHNETVPLNQAFDHLNQRRRLKSILGPFDLYGSTIQDPLLRSRRELVCQIFQLVDYPENLEISVAALRAIQDMAESPVFASSASLGDHQPSNYSPHKLFSILETAGMLESVRQAYVRRLEREEPEAHNINETKGEQVLHAFGLTNYIRLQILDFLLKHGTRFGSGYNLAHYLLGFPIPGTSFVQSDLFGDPKKAGVPPSCLHIVLELLDWGLGQPSSPVVMVEHPSLGVRLYQLIALLIENPVSRGPIRAFLKDWSLRQVKNVSSELLDPKDPSFTVHDLMQRGWLFAAVASDLHEAISVSREYSYAERLAAALIKDGGDSGSKLERPKIVALLQGLSSSLTIISQVSREKVELMEELSAAFNHAISSLLRILELVLFASRETHLQLAEMVQNSGICGSLYNLLSECINNNCLPVGALEKISASVLAITTFQLQHAKVSLIGLEDHISILLRICLRQDGSTIARGYVYAALVATINRPSIGFKAEGNSSTFAVIAHSVKEVVSRFLLVLCADATASISQDFEAWSTLAFSALAALINLFSRQSMLMLVLEELGQSGFLKTLLLSLAPNESRLAALVQPTSELASSNLNPLLLWKAKFALLEQLCLRPEGMNKMVELDMIEHLQALRVLTWKGGDSLGMQSNFGMFPAIQARLEEIIEPVLRLLALVLVGGSADGENGGLMVKKRIRTLLGSHQEPILDLLRIRGPLEAKVDELVQHASNLALIRHVLVLLNGTVSEEDTPLLIPVARSLCANILIKCLGVLEQTILGEQAPVMILKVLAEVLSFQRMRTMVMVASLADQQDHLPLSLPYNPDQGSSGSLAEMAQTGQLSISILERLMIVVVKHIRAESDRLVSSRSLSAGAAEDQGYSRVSSISILLFIWDMLLYLAWTHFEHRHLAGGGKEDAEVIRSLFHAFIPAIDSFCEIPNISTDSYGPSVPMRPLTIQRWIRQFQVMSEEGSSSISNVQKLTETRRRKVNNTNKPAIFDGKARLEYLTGFHKRKVAKRKEIAAKRERQALEERKERRKEKRARVKKAMNEVISLMTEPTQQPITDVRDRMHFTDGTTVLIICEKLTTSNLPDLPTNRFLVPAEFTVGNFATIVRSRLCGGGSNSSAINVLVGDQQQLNARASFMAARPSISSDRQLSINSSSSVTTVKDFKLGPEMAIFLFVNNALLPMNAVLSAVYAERADIDGFLYVVYSGENTFGN